jgi:hypothetical protein
MPEWRFLTNHGLVLSYISRHPRITARDLADAIGITERKCPGTCVPASLLVSSP